jgi:membrane-bound lytic murein transglycosylase D
LVFRHNRPQHSRFATNPQFARVFAGFLVQIRVYRMKRAFTLAILLFFFTQLSPRAQEFPPINIDELLAGAEDWAKENLDDEVFELLEDVDRDRVRGFLIEFEARLQTNSVYELAPLREQAKELVPFLEQWEETLPLAQWLKTRLDYLDVSEELKRAQPPKPTTVIRPPPPLPLQRSTWKRQFERRPLPTKATSFVPRLKEIFISEKTPPELVWVAEVESSFNPKARSPVGAAGLFQLMKPTAQSYGLSTFLPDERTDPEKNARAAAKYLRHLHKRFGNWPLALAAYNAGETRVDNLLKKSTVRDFPSIATKLPAETQLYVPKCEAALQKREGISLADLKIPAG